MSFSTCNNCDSHCFPTPSGCVEYRGNTHKDLGIYQGDSLEVVLEMLVAEIKRIGDIVDDCSFCGGSSSNSTTSVSFPAPKYGVGSNYVQNVYDIEAIPFNYSVARGTNKHTVNYDVQSFANSLPVGAEFREVSVTALSEKLGGLSNTIYQSTEKIGGFDVSPSSLPASLTLNARVRTTNGDIVLSKLLPLTGSEEGSFNSYFDANVSSPTPQEMTAEQYNDVISGEIAKLQRNIEDLKSKIS